jgi:hypothetical protein
MPYERNSKNHRTGVALADPGDKILATQVGLIFPRDVPYDEWRKAGLKLSRIASTSTWCLGDWVAHGHEHYHDRYREAIEAANLDYQTLRNYVWIARRFAVSRRRDSLSFQHHAEVAALPAHEQDQWLDLAEKNTWSRNELRRRIRTSEEAARTDAGQKKLLPRIEVMADRVERWRSAASRENMSLDDWILISLDRAASDGS